MRRPDQVLRGAGYDGRIADLWSCGCILFVLCAGKMPFDEAQLPHLFLAIAGAKYRCPAHFSPALAHLVSRLITPDPQKRVGLEEVRAHEWFLAGGGYLPAQAPAEAAGGGGGGAGDGPQSYSALLAAEDWAEIEARSAGALAPLLSESGGNSPFAILCHLSTEI